MTTGRINQVTTVESETRRRGGVEHHSAASLPPETSRTLADGRPRSLTQPKTKPNLQTLRQRAAVAAFGEPRPRCRRPAVSTTRRRRKKNRKKIRSLRCGQRCNLARSFGRPPAGGQAHLCGAPAQAQTAGRRPCGTDVTGRAPRDSQREPGGTPTQKTAQTCQNRSRQIRNLCCDACPS